MRNFTLKRQNHENPNFRELNQMRAGLEEIICSKFEIGTAQWNDMIKEIIQFQYKDGSFNLLDSYHIVSDCRVEYCHEPTYICTAILIKTFLEDKKIFAGKEYSILPRALKMCCARELRGHGYDELEGLFKALNYFMACDVKRFLTKYPDMCPEFTEMFEKIKERIADRVSKELFKGDWGEDYKDEMLKIYKYFFEQGYTTIFVYGTLLKGQRNHKYYLSKSEFCGEATISGYEMYDCGYYPAIVPGTGTVSGEVYRVTDDELSNINRLEREGDLYIKTLVPIIMHSGKKLEGWVYVYNDSVEGYPKVTGRYGNEELWYVSYGSNMFKERLKYYIEGGVCTYNGRSYSPCEDVTIPTESRAVIIPYDVYYSNYDRGAWKNSAVSFLDLSKPGKAYGRAYKIKKSQLDHIHRQEGAGFNWYPVLLRLSDIDGLPAYTCANDVVKIKEPFSKVSAEYGFVLYKGMKETYPEFSDEQIYEYLKKCGDVSKR